ncbi:SusC/RagA family TonB-linked outer membrane protein [Parabacteroides provencensis]|uniref:SusC/RagA family TonB-linked outer membrane protein n=1 Tax=Parabacteroides provencensis TaxID=1944636 RepID=UPI000C1518F0|nr:SusC/RagA family TonB-linked outer membrane protein [Parabacteroides provencensis]
MTKNCYIQLGAHFYDRFWWVPKLTRTMKLTCLLLCMSISIAFASHSYAQTATLSIRMTEKTVAEILETIEKQTDFQFFYNSKLINVNRKVSVNAQDADVFVVLNQLFEGSDVHYKVVDRDVILTKMNVLVDEKTRITGRVLDEYGEPIIGANVLVKGTSFGCISDIEGKFEFETQDIGNGVLQVSYIGYITQDIPLKGKTSLIVKLETDVLKVSEVVVVGYGSVEKKELTSAVTSVSSKDFLQGAFTSPLSMIDGKVSGVSVSNPAAADPNASPNIQMRGASSIDAGNTPLVIVDGMPGADLRNIANQDIESITILKDGSAAAIYGSRAANGVILIQTKKGKAGKVSVTYDGYMDHDMVANKPEVLSAEEFLAHKRDIDFGSHTNWYDQLLRKNNIGQNHYVAVSGGGENLTFRASANYKTKEGLDIGSSRKEYGVRMGFSAKTLKGLLEVSGNLSTRVINEEYVDYKVFQQAVKLNPTHPMMDKDDPDKYSILYGFDTYNPVGDIKDQENGGDRQFSLADFKIKLNILPNLNTEVSLARQSQEYLRRLYINSKHKESVDNMRQGRARLQNENWTDYTFEWIGNYFTSIDKHTIKLMAGYSYQEFNHRMFFAENANFPSDVLSYNNLQAGDWNMASGRLGMESLKEKEKTIGFPARLNYNYDDTYYLTASVRYEGNSKFGANHKWGWFPAASAAWRLSNLPVIKSVKNIDELKLRFSYGATGRSGFPMYSALARYKGGERWQNDLGQWIQTWGPANNPNPDLHWEKQISYNLGLDFGFFQNKLSGSLDAYIRKGKDVISNYDAPLPPFMYDQIFTNVASTSSKGIELTLNWDAVRTKDFSYSTNVIVSYTKSKLDKFSNGTYQKGYMDRYYLPAPGLPGYAQRLKDGTEVGTFWGLKYAGVDESGNMLVWKDAKEGGEKILANGVASDADKGSIGHGAPRYALTWGNTLRYKGFDLTLYFQGKFDYQILNMYQMYYGLMAEPGINLLKDAYGKNGLITSGKVMCDYFLENGNYFRLDNITLGWTPSLKTDWISNLRIYGTIKNAFTLTGYSVMDPTAVDINGLEPGVSGLNVYPVARSFTIGIQISY